MKLYSLAILLLAAVPQVASARPYRIASIGQTAVLVLDMESIRPRQPGTFTAVITGIGKRPHGAFEPLPMVQQTKAEIDCAGGNVRLLNEVSLTPDLAPAAFSAKTDGWRKANGAEADVVALVCAPSNDPSLNLEATDLAVLIKAVQGGIQ